MAASDAGMNPPRYRPVACACGQVHAADTSGAVPACSAGAVDDALQAHWQQAQERALVRALFPQPVLRRRLLQAVGASTLHAAIAAALPAGALTALQAAAQESPKAARAMKRDVKLGFIPITCATPLIAAHPLGLYQKQGLQVQLVKTPGWAAIRERSLKGELDATHFLSPMPLAMTLGLGSEAADTHVASIQNTNGQAITLSLKHKDNRDPKNWKGFKFGIPFEYSMHNLLLRYYLAEHRLNPDSDVQLRIVPPAEMVAALRAGTIDGFLGPDPFNQRAVFEGVGFIHILSKDIWDGHPCCAFGATRAFIQSQPETFAALYRAIISASVLASMPGAREQMAKAIAAPEYLNQPPELLTQVLTGQFEDGLGNRREVPDRVIFDPVPWYSQAIWMLTQLKRWGYLKGDVSYQQLAEKVFLLTDAKKQMAQAGWRAPDGVNRPHKIMGRQFDPTQPEEYVRSFAIQRSV